MRRCQLQCSRSDYCWVQTFTSPNFEVYKSTWIVISFCTTMTIFVTPDDEETFVVVKCFMSTLVKISSPACWFIEMRFGNSSLPVLRSFHANFPPGSLFLGVTSSWSGRKLNHSFKCSAAERKPVLRNARSLDSPFLFLRAVRERTAEDDLHWRWNIIRRHLFYTRRRCDLFSSSFYHLWTNQQQLVS